MLSALARGTLRRPGAMLAAAVAALAVASVLAAWAAGRLPLVGPETARSESERAADELGAGLGHEASPAVLIVTRGDQRVGSGVYGVALDVLSSQAMTAPGVVEVRRSPVSRDGRTTALRVYFDDDDPRSQHEAVGDLRRELDPGPLELAVGGQAAVLRDARDAVWGELVLLELLALPLAVLVLGLTLGWRLSAGPVLAAATGVLGSVGLIGIVDEATSVSVMGVAPAAVVAIVVGIEASLILAARYRDELATLGSRDDAMHRTLDGAGRAVVFGSLGAAGMAAALAVVPVLDARSAALGGALAALLTGAVALVAVPSFLVLSGDRDAGPGRGREPGFVYRMQVAVTGSRILTVATAILPAAALLAVASSATRLETLPIDAAGLPDDAEAHTAEVRIVAELGPETTAPVTVSAEPGARAGLKGLRFELAGVPGIAEARGPSHAGPDHELLRAGTEARPGSLGARAAVEDVRAVPYPAAAAVGGRDAEALDADRALLDRGPIAAGVGAILLAMILVAGGLRSAVPAVVLAIASLLPAAAAVGLLVVTFQDARLTEPLDYAAQGGPALASTVAALAAVAAVSGWRTAQLVGALAVERQLGFGLRAAVPPAVSLTLHAAGAATVVAGAATVVLAGSDLVAAKELGIAIAAGLALDLALARALLVPALARLCH
jgi:putative drug exporter of the RND superfamily